MALNSNLSQALRSNMQVALNTCTCRQAIGKLSQALRGTGIIYTDEIKSTVNQRVTHLSRYFLYCKLY